jgi:hypothetical protein
MRIREFAAALALIISLTAYARAQQPAVPSPEFAAELQTASADQLKAEKLFSMGQRGPDSEPCRLMNSYLFHIVKAAAAAGAKTRITGWSDLTWDEQNAVAQSGADLRIERNKRMRQAACSDNPR